MPATMASSLGVEPLNRFETSVLNLRRRRSRSSIASTSGVRPAARHLPHEHRGAVDRRRHPRRRHPVEALPRLRERSRRAGVGPRAVERGRAGVVGYRATTAGSSSNRSRQGQVDRRAAAIWRRSPRARTRSRRTVCGICEVCSQRRRSCEVRRAGLSSPASAGSEDHAGKRSEVVGQQLPYRSRALGRTPICCHHTRRCG